jgi:hypothetical protein
MALSLVEGTITETFLEDSGKKFSDNKYSRCVRALEEVTNCRRKTRQFLVIMMKEDMLVCIHHHAEDLSDTALKKRRRRRSLQLLYAEGFTCIS